jgi:hypothetical protein
MSSNTYLIYYRRDIAEAYLLDYIQWARDEVKKVTDVFTVSSSKSIY